jgi:hypothetical protein
MFQKKEFFAILQAAAVLPNTCKYILYYLTLKKQDKTTTD